MNTNILQIFITRSVFVMASQFLYQRVQGGRVERRILWRHCRVFGSHFWRPGTGVSYSIRPPLNPSILPFDVIALRGESYNMLCVL